MNTRVMCTLRLIVLTGLLFVSYNLFSIDFQNITVSNGLSNRRVYCAAQDKKGFIWFATRVGIDKFNGESFTHYDFRIYNDYYKIRGVLNDRNGRIYAFTERSLYLYDESLNSFVQIPLLYDNQKDILGDETIVSIYFDKDNSIWLGTSAGLFVSHNRISWKKIPQYGNYTIFCFSEGTDGDFWIGTTQGVYCIYRSNLKQYHCKSTSQIPGLSNIRIQTLFYDKTTGLLWVGTFSNGIYVYNQAVNSSAALQNIQAISSPIRAITLVNNAEIWVGVDGAGIFVYNKDNLSLLQKYSQNPNSDGRFESNSIYHILNIDNQVWVSTYTAGILACNTRSISNHIYRHQKDNNNSLYNNDVNSVLEDSNGTIWFGTNAGISRYSPSTGKWQHILTNSAGQSIVILTLCEVGDLIWAGGYAADLYSINKNSGAVKSYTIRHQTEITNKKNYIYDIAADKHGNLWLGGNLDKLTRFNPKSGETKYYDVQGTHKFKFLNDTILLVASIHGLYSVNIETGRFNMTDFSKASYKNRQINTFINSIFVDPNQKNVVWLGTEGEGLYRYNMKTRKVRIYNTSNGISSNYIYGIQNDEFGCLWLSSENGLNCFNPKTDVNESYFELDGMSDNTFNFLAYTKLRNGNMIWGTPRGATEISPENIRKENNPINLHFTSFSLFYQPVDAGQEDSPLRTSIDDTNEIKLRHNQNSFSFDFIDLNLSSAPQVMYSWKLDGFDNQWSTPSKEHKAIYTNIPPGRYTFSVRAYKLGNNATNRQDSVIRSIEVVVERPFWASYFAYLVYLVLFVFLIRAVNNFMKNRLEAQHSEEKIRFFVNMAHDVRTPITLVKAPLNELEHEQLSEDGKSALSLAQRNLEKLFNIVTQLLDFQKAENESMKLLVEKTALNSFVKSVASNFITVAKEKSIDFKIMLPADETYVWIDRKKLSLCIENLISNSIKYTNPKGNIQIAVGIIENLLKVEVVDDGMGIPQKEQKNLFERFYRAENAVNSKETGSGIGLMLTKKLIQLHKGKISFQSEEKIGTTFQFEIPCFSDSYSKDEIFEKEDRVDLIEDEQAEENNKKGVKLMLVEDNDEMRDYLSKQLRREYDVIEARDGNEALELIKNDAPDFVLSDIMMPGISGFELCSILKKKIDTCHIPVILLSSLSDRKDILTGFNCGADDYITKPFDLTILETKIKAILKNRVLFKKKYISKTAQKDEFASINELDKVFMEKVINFIEENLTNEDFTIDNLAMEMAMSRSVFYKKLKSLTDDNPKDLIKEIKMRKASELLQEGKYPIAEIAFLTGFPNAKYFSTAFKKYYGVSPSRFINSEDDTELEDADTE